jgi:hypothetical protein
LEVDRLKELAQTKSEMVWRAETKWAQAYLDGEIEAIEYGGGSVKQSTDDNC